jgi:K+-sensing histidine kinase KdpD
MERLAGALKFYQAEDPAEAFVALAEWLHAALTYRAALLIDRDEHITTWPASIEVSADLVDTCMHALRSAVIPIEPELSFDAAAFPHSELLVVPVRSDALTGTIVVIGDEGTLEKHLHTWEDASAILAACADRLHRLAQAEAESIAMHRRAEEIEALHTLGLSANRTLETREVLELVARFTRTLLGAHYVTVHTSAAGMIDTVASVGLRKPTVAQNDDLLARRIMEARKPITVGMPVSTLRVEDLPFHASEGMQVGLGLPLALFRDTFGALIVGYRRPYEIAERDIRLGLALAGHAAVAISNARLHQKVELHSMEVANALAQLREATTARTRLFNSISQNLTTPIDAILECADLLLEGQGGTLNDKGIEYARNARDHADGIAALVNDLLASAKIEERTSEAELQPAHLGEVADDSAARRREA